MRGLFAAIGTAGAALLLAACRPDAPPADAAVRLAATFEDLHRRELFDGAVVVSVGGKPVFSQGYGLANVELEVPLTPDTPVDGASLAKTFTAALVLQLAHEGRLELDAPLTTLLPELPYPELTLSAPARPHQWPARLPVLRRLPAARPGPYHRDPARGAREAEAEPGVPAGQRVRVQQFRLRPGGARRRARGAEHTTPSSCGNATSRRSA
jgi:CubicO group peptidase (beta-lactamase class C family)